MTIQKKKESSRKKENINNPYNKEYREKKDTFE